MLLSLVCWLHILVSHLQKSETFSRHVGEYQSTLRNISEEQRSRLHREGSPQSCRWGASKGNMFNTLLARPRNHGTNSRAHSSCSEHCTVKAFPSCIQTEGSLPFTQKSYVLGRTFRLRSLTTQYSVTVATLWPTLCLLDIRRSHSDANVDSCLPGYDSTYGGQDQPIFRRTMLPLLLYLKCHSTADVFIEGAAAAWPLPI